MIPTGQDIAIVPSHRPQLHRQLTQSTSTRTPSTTQRPASGVVDNTATGTGCDKPPLAIDILHRYRSMNERYNWRLNETELVLAAYAGTALHFSCTATPPASSSTSSASPRM